MAQYTNSGPIDTNVSFSTDNVRGKTAIVTGGANGIGEAYVRKLVSAGAFVVIGDLDEPSGKRLEDELSGAIKFVRCDMTKWADQLAMFKTALSSSKSGRVDTVVANAGISGYDSVFFNDITFSEPEEPKLNIAILDLLAVLYTVKLALFYFRKQNAAHPELDLDQVLLLTGSMAGYVDVSGGVQYTASKHGLRGIMACLRRTEVQHRIRVNFIAPWFIKTKLISDTAVTHLNKAGMQFAEVDDAGQAALRAIADRSVNGRSFAVVPRDISPSGYIDVDRDDYEENTWLAKLQHQAGFASHRSQLDAKSQKTSTLWSSPVD